MRVATFTDAEGRRALGAVEGDAVRDLSAAGVPGTMLDLLAGGPDALAGARAACARAPRRALADVRLAAPIARPPKILAVGLNYRAHAAEGGRAAPPVPVIFNKQATAVTGPFDAIHRPPESVELDYEGELALVVGTRCRRVPREHARAVVAGYAVADDVSVRDWQRRVPTMTMGKSWDTHCPFGPWIVTADEVPDPGTLRLRTWVNGELRQDATTADMIFDCDTLVAHLSTAFTLEPGDLILTGTPAGVGLFMDPPRWLAPGDVVRIEIAGLGAIENPVVNEPATTVRY
jgi:2-keto-4-pentenoate hydratase/2-oxohepta-3-ene-1,7-dioic acid hydratase in catechol pathway